MVAVSAPLSPRGDSLNHWNKWVHPTEPLVDLAVTETRYLNKEYLSPLMLINKGTRGGAKANDAIALRRALQGTSRAVSLGVALAAVDGPLPVMDVIGLGVTMVYSAAAWIDYFSS